MIYFHTTKFTIFGFLRPGTAKEWVFSIDLYTIRWNRNYQIILKCYMFNILIYIHWSPWKASFPVGLKISFCQLLNVCQRAGADQYRSAGIISKLIGWFVCLRCMHTVNVCTCWKSAKNCVKTYLYVQIFTVLTHAQYVYYNCIYFKVCNLINWGLSDEMCT